MRFSRTLPVSLLALAGCTSHQVEIKPIEIKPIHLTIDINLNVQRELDDFFDFEEEIEASEQSSEEEE